jgi:DNA-binding transcriptional regulator GbsR (MarR family)
MPAAQSPYKSGLLSVSYFIESANNSLNSLNSLLRKDSYRNKILHLNNPVNNELGFSLKNEILLALKPIMDKTKKADTKKFREVIENFLNNPEDNGIKSVKKHMPALGIFSTVLSLVGNLVISEKTITKEDLNKFIERIDVYFYQYEKLNAINEAFGEQVIELLDRAESAKNDLKEFLVECISTLRPSLPPSSIHELQIEVLLQKYYDPQKLMNWFDTTASFDELALYPPDAATTVKTITSVIRKLQKEFENIYSENYKQLRELIASLKTTLANLDQAQIAKTSAELDQLYTDSRQADVVNLNISLVQERMNTVCRLINRK